METLNPRAQCLNHSGHDERIRVSEEERRALWVELGNKLNVRIFLTITGIATTIFAVAFAGIFGTMWNMNIRLGDMKTDIATVMTDVKNIKKELEK